MSSPTIRNSPTEKIEFYQAEASSKEVKKPTSSLNSCQDTLVSEPSLGPTQFETSESAHSSKDISFAASSIASSILSSTSANPEPTKNFKISFKIEKIRPGEKPPHRVISSTPVRAAAANAAAASGAAAAVNAIAQPAIQNLSNTKQKKSSGKVKKEKDHAVQKPAFTLGKFQPTGTFGVAAAKAPSIPPPHYIHFKSNWNGIDSGHRNHEMGEGGTKEVSDLILSVYQWALNNPTSILGKKVLNESQGKFIFVRKGIHQIQQDPHYGKICHISVIVNNTPYHFNFKETNAFQNADPRFASSLIGLSKWEPYSITTG